MPEPTPAPDPIEQADASFRRARSLEEIARDTAPLGADESFAIADLSEDEWDRFVRAINE